MPRLHHPLAVTALLAATAFAAAPAAPALAVTPEERAYALVLALAKSEQALLNAEGAVAVCTPAGHRACLPRTARTLMRVARAQRRPVARATKLQHRGSCSRRAGRRYLRSLTLLESGARGLAHARSKKALNAAADLLARSDALEQSAVKAATACWRKTLR